MKIIMKITQYGLRGLEREMDRLAAKAERVVDTSVGKLAHEYRRMILKGIRSQAPGGIRFKPLAKSTIKRKGSSKALIDHGDLIRSINVTKVGPGVYFVGVHRMTSVRIGSITLVNIAEIHEFGSKKRPGRPPARPFLRTSYRAWQRTAQERFAYIVAKELGLKRLGSLGAAVGGKFGGVQFDDAAGEGTIEGWSGHTKRGKGGD